MDFVDQYRTHLLLPGFICNADADLAGDVMTMRSHSGHSLCCKMTKGHFSPSCGLLRNSLACRGAQQKLK